MKRRTKLLFALLGLLALLATAAWIVYGGGEHEGPGTVHPRPLPDDVLDERSRTQRRTAATLTDGAPAKQILFGDLHVHTTFSADAFLRSLPFLRGEGAHPPADACDFARYCSGLDFFALTDHAEALTPRHWRESAETIRQCNAVAGDPADPDLVAYLGWEWSHVGRTPGEHYGHKNVVFRGTGDDQIPARPIGAGGVAAGAFAADLGLSTWTLATIPIREFPRRQRYLDLVTYVDEIASLRNCPEGVDTRELPPDCRELAETPADLFEKLDQWGMDSLVIPHGTTWGFYTPPGYTWDEQLAAAQRSARQRLLEVYSGHGNSEEYRPWRATRGDPDAPTCPPPRDGHEPCCWRAGEIIRSRCGDAGEAECQERVEKARADYLAAGAAGRLAIPGTTVEDWRDCGQCRDCFAPSFSYRPGGSAQYILARGNFEDPGAPRHERFGFIASSDNHSARPGTGYKEIQRRKMTDASGPRSRAWRDRIFGSPRPPAPTSTTRSREELMSLPPFRLLDLERQASFFMTGGLVAAHSAGRDRDAIWDALQRREVYGTSGPRILLWFDLVNAPGGAAPMGAEVELAEPPRFAVRAAGGLVQKPGCPDFGDAGPGPERIARVCAGECYHPGSRRRRISRIEVVRIRPQAHPDEPIEDLVEDPWRVLDCPGDRPTCRVELEDPEFPSAGRDTVYYVRAIQEPTEAINADNLRCADEDCSELRPCYGDWRTPYHEDCLAEIEERAWSSPIFVAPAPGRAEEAR